eukprot:scaffold5395_cov139-Amphora_coffeaeformis.AAC.1
MWSHVEPVLFWKGDTVVPPSSPLAPDGHGVTAQAPRGVTDGCGVDALTLEREHEQGNGTGNRTENLIPFKTRILVPLMNQNSADVAHLSPYVTHLFRSTLHPTVNGSPSTLYPTVENANADKEFCTSIDLLSLSVLTE